MRYSALNKHEIKVNYPLWWIVAALSLCGLFALSISPYAYHYEQKTGLHWLFHLRGPVSPPADIAIIALSSGSAEQLNLPRQSNAWPRTVYADLLARLTQADAKMVVLDIAFREQRDEPQDFAFEQALKNSKTVLFKYLMRHQIPLGNGFLDIEEEIPPIPRFARNAFAVGSFVLPKYPAEVSHAYLYTELSQGWEPTQPLLTLLALEWPDSLGTPINESIPKQEDLTHLQQWIQDSIRQSLSSGGSAFFNLKTLPNPMPINYYGPAETLTTWPVDAVLKMDPDHLRSAFSQKIVYVGYSDNRQTEQQDAYRTVFSNKHGVDISGVEISATVFANLKHGHYLKPPSPSLFLAVLSIFLTITVLSHLLPAILLVFAQTTLLTLYGVIATYLFRHQFFWLPLLFPILALLVGNGIIWSLRYLQQKEREQKIRYMLNQYLPSDAAHKLSKNFNRLEQQRQLVHGVCLMTDVHGYTSLAETLPPTELHALLNRYYAVLIKAVEEQGGFIGNLVGDGMLALWTGPHINQNMCESAVNAARKIQERLASDPILNSQLPTSFALHGGQFSLGNLGNIGHFEYSPVGDMVNTTARIENMNRLLGTKILCSQSVATHLLHSGVNQLRFLGNFALRNKAQLVALYTFHQLHSDMLKNFEQAYEYYECQNYEAALAIFQTLANDYADGPSLYFLHECRKALNTELIKKNEKI